MFFLTQDQAYITLCEFTNLSYKEVDQELVNLKKHLSGQYAIFLRTGNKLRLNVDASKFYLDSYNSSEHDNLYVYDFLELLNDYWESLECDIECSEKSLKEIEKDKKSLEFKKLCYQGYKQSIEY